MSLAMLCLQPYLCLGAHTAYCRRVETTDAPGTLFTWVPARAEIVLLIRANGYTLIYAPSMDTVFYARPEVALLCADMTVVAAQFFIERGMPRLLAFDILCDGGRDQSGTEAAARHRRLQAMQHLMKGPVTVQWCGDREALNEEFFMKLPHQTAGLLALTDHPLIFSRGSRARPVPTAEAATLETDDRRVRGRML